LRKRNSDFENLFENFFASEKIEINYKDLKDREKLEFMLIVHAYVIFEF